MNCQNIAEILDDGDSRSLSAAARLALDAHVGGCAECRAAVAAHEAMGAMAMPALSPRLAECLRSAVTAQSASRTRRAGGRPFFVVGLLLAGAAAAAFLGLGVIGRSGDVPVLSQASETVPDSAEDADEPAALSSAESGEAPAGSGEPAGVVPGSTGFTVGMTPLRQLSTNPEVIRATETVYRAFLDELRKIPNLELVMLTADESWSTEFTAGSAFVIGDAATDASPFQEFEAVANISNLIEPAIAGTVTDGTRTLVLVDSRNLVQAGSDEEVDLSTVPTAPIRQIEQVRAGASVAAGAEATPGVVNVILDNNIEGVRVDMSYGATVAGAMVEPEPLAYDVVLEATAPSHAGSNVWTFAVHARSRSGGALSTSVGGEIGTLVDPSDFIERLIATLQAEIFPVDEAVLAALTQKVLDTRLPLDEWLSELNQLKQMTGRAGNTRLSDDVARAIVDMGARITDPRQLSSYIQALEGLDNAVLVQPLGHALRNSENEAIRLEAAMQMARFRQDPAVRAALEAAANADPSPDVRLNARWAALDEAGHRNLIVTTLLDTRLTDSERIEPLLLDLGWARIEPVDLGSAIDATVVNQLSELLRRHEPAATRARVLGRLSRESSQALTPLFVELLRDDESEVVRTSAASGLGRRLDEPGARQALERATTDDPSPAVRQAAARWLAGPGVFGEFVLRN